MAEVLVWGSEARALSQELLLALLWAPSSSAVLSDTRPTSHLHLTDPGVGAFSSLALHSALCRNRNQTNSIIKLSHFSHPRLGTAIATPRGRKHGRKSFLSALLFRVLGGCCKHSLSPGLLRVSRYRAGAAEVCSSQGSSNTAWEAADPALEPAIHLLCPPKASPTCVGTSPPARPEVKPRFKPPAHPCMIWGWLLGTPPLAVLPNGQGPACAGPCLTQGVWRPKLRTFSVSGSLNTLCRHPLCPLAEDCLGWSQQRRLPLH